MANPELGAKQICPTCSAKFYDLGRRPAHCPKCDSEFDPEEALRNRRVRTRPMAAEEDEAEAVVKPVEAEDGFEPDVEEAPELDAGVDAAPLLTDDEDGADETEVAAGPGESLGVDFAEEDEIEAADDEVPFIEDEDDAFSDDEIDGLPAEGSTED
ncbi:MAG TPA: TIGR02300 family protein [Caulobacteraceae bacterium]